jgi:hypothetical protein
MLGPEGKMGLRRSMRIFWGHERGAERRGEVLMTSVLVRSLVHLGRLGGVCKMKALSVYIFAIFTIDNELM